MAENDKKIDVIYVPNIDDRKHEEFLRFNILISYFDTDYYQNHYTSCERVFETINKELHSYPPYSRKQTAGDSKQLKDRCKEDVNYALYLLFNRTGIPYSHSYDKKKRLFDIVEPKYYYDYFPLTIRRYLPEHPKMLTLMFDLERGLEYQLQFAKEKLKDAQDKLMTNAPTKKLTDDFKTTRRTLRSIDKAMKVVAFRDLKNRNRTKKMNWEDIASALDLKYETARKRYKMGNNLILSGEIRKYFPEFR